MGFGLVTLSDLALWNDKRGRFSWLRAITLVILLLPALDILHASLTGGLGPRPITEALHRSGLWTIRFLMITLLLTPMRRIARYAYLVDIRRMVGVSTTFYILLHFTLYWLDQKWNPVKVFSEIFARVYLTIGFAALIGLVVLGITSNDYMVRKLGGIKWKRLHLLVYPIAALGLAHYFMQAKLEVFEPTIVAGLFGWMMIYRLMHWTLPRNWQTPTGEYPVWMLIILAIVAAAAAFFFEAVGYWAVYHVSIVMILGTNFDFSGGLRAGWYVLFGGLILAAIAALRLGKAGWIMRKEARAAPQARQ